MFGHSQNSIQLLCTLLLGLVATSCREYYDPDISGEETNFFRESHQCDAGTNANSTADETTGYAGYEKGSVALTPMDPLVEASCAIFSAPIRFSIDDTHHGIFLLQPIFGFKYCVSVNRESGYITLSHEEGEVSRDGNLFTWCLERKSLKDDTAVDFNRPARLEVQSLTPESEFTINLRRGME